MVQELTRPASLRRGAAPDTAFAFLDGEFIPVRDAKVSVLTHAFNYGTGVFEGIRAYWNAEDEQLYALHLKEHYLRLHRSLGRVYLLGVLIGGLGGLYMAFVARVALRPDSGSPPWRSSG